MSMRIALCLGVILVGGSTPAWTQQAKLPPGSRDPFLRLEPYGPTSFVTALAFSPDGKTLYAGGFDKVVRAWTRNASGEFVIDGPAYRVPIGPGTSGAINAIALSDDGSLLAAAGHGPFRGEAGFRQAGIVINAETALNADMREDEGLIYVFDTRSQALVALLRGCRGAVARLTFAPAHPNKRPLLVSAAKEWDEQARMHVGTIRLWDVEHNQYLAGAWDVTGLASSATPGKTEVEMGRPSLAVWHTGGQLQEMQVAIAWDDGHLRIWDAEQADAGARKLGDIARCNSVVYLSDERALFAGGFLNDKGRIEIWDAGKNQWQKRQPALELPQPDGVYHYPRALVPLSSRGNGKLDAVAIALQTTRLNARGGDTLLQLIKLEGRSAAPIRAPVLLWPGNATGLPVLAASPRGDYVAAAGNDTHQILVYSIGDLLNQTGQPQSLRGVGSAFTNAEFAASGKDEGLLLTTATGRWVFDFVHSKLTDEIKNWTAESPQAGGWAATVTERSSTIAVQAPNGRTKRIQLPDKVQATVVAMLPPRAALSIPILAVGEMESGQQTRLVLYDAKSGKALRQLTGHTDRILSLAFSADGRLLVSAAGDETACIWTLTDLGRVLGQHGLPPFKPTIDKKGIIRVGTITEEDPASSSLDAEDVIEGLVEADRFRATTTLRELYEAAHLLKVGKTMTLRLRGPKGNRDVAVPVIQEIDEQKPLFSFFLIPGPKGRTPEWIGWNPIGPYESSGLLAERYLGWHFNTGERRAPTRFASADQYRKEYFRPGLLKDLIQRGELRVFHPRPLPPPRITLLIEEDHKFRANGQEDIVVRRSQVRFHLALSGRPMESLSSLTWQIDSRPEEKINLETASGREWSAPVQLRHGVHTLRVSATTPPEVDESDPNGTVETRSRTTTASLTVRYQPPPPRIQLKEPVKQFVVRDRDFVVGTLVHTGLAGEGVTVRFSHRHGTQEVFSETQALPADAAWPQTLNKKLQLRPGYNVIDVVATNTNALAGYEQFETASLRPLEITLLERGPPPGLTLEAVLPEGKTQRTIPIEGQTIRVDASRVTISGKIQAKENLTEAQWQKQGSEDATTLRGFVPQTAKQFTIREVCRLQPGAQTLLFRAKTQTSDEAVRALRFFFQPPVPAPAIVKVVPGASLQGEEPHAKVDVIWQLTAPPERFSYKAQVFINEKESDAPLKADEAAGTLSTTLLVSPGTSRIEIRLSNAWGSVRSAETQVSYTRPPRVVQWQTPAETQDARIDLVARIRSPMPLLPERIRLRVNDARQFLRPQIARQTGEKDTWVLRFQGVLLEGAFGNRAAPRTNQLRLWVGNAEADCHAEATVLYKPVQPPPEVEFERPATDGGTATSRLKVQVLARSTTKLKKVELLREGDPPLAMDVAAQELDAKGNFLLIAEAEVNLRPDFNRLRLSAVNDGGEAHTSISLNYVRPPPQLEITELVLPEGSSIAVKPGERDVTLPTSRATLRGRLYFDERDAERVDRAEQVRIYINGFQQRPADLHAKAPNGTEGWVRTFQTDILLNGVDNHVEMTLAHFPKADGPQQQFTIHCHRPQPAQRLHVLIVSPGDDDPEPLRADVERALVSPAFQSSSSVVLVGTEAKLENVQPQLVTIRYVIEAQAKAAALNNDTFVVYYRGAETVGTEGHMFTLYAPPLEADKQRFALPCDWIAEVFASTPGAQILLLDVGRRPGADPKDKAARDKIENWAHDFADVEHHAAVLRYAWLGKGATPADARLVTVLQEAMPTTKRLIEVRNFVREFPLRKQLQWLDPRDYIPLGLESLALGRKR
jgi:WD40 repeat protein